MCSAERAHVRQAIPLPYAESLNIIGPIALHLHQAYFVPSAPITTDEISSLLVTQWFVQLSSAWLLALRQSLQIPQQNIEDIVQCLLGCVALAIHREDVLGISLSTFCNWFVKEIDVDDVQRIGVDV